MADPAAAFVGVLFAPDDGTLCVPAAGPVMTAGTVDAADGTASTAKTARRADSTRTQRIADIKRKGQGREPGTARRTRVARFGTRGTDQPVGSAPRARPLAVHRFTAPASLGSSPTQV